MPSLLDEVTVQDSPYPQAPDSDATLGLPADNVASALTVPMTTTSITATVANAANIPVWSLITFGAELMQISGKSGNVLTFGTAAAPGSLAGRGLSGTTIAAHKAGVVGYLNTNAWYHQAQSSAIVAIETEVKRRMPTVMDWGAVGDGVHDDTAAIQAAINAATGGGVVYFPKGVYKITVQINLVASVNLIGPRGTMQGSMHQPGALLKWAGPAPAAPWVEGSAMVAAHGVNGTRLDGINFDGSNTPNLTGYMVDAFPGGTCQNNSYYGGCFQHFGNAASDVVGAAMSFGDDQISNPGGQEEIDGCSVENFFLTDCYIGVRIYNANFALSRFVHFYMFGINKGFDLEYGGYHIVEQGCFGTMQGTNPSCVYIPGAHGPVVYRQLQAESDVSPGGNAMMFNFPNGVDTSPIIIESCIWGFPSNFQTQRIISIGNDLRGPNRTVTLGDNVLVTSIMDLYETTGKIVLGVNAGWNATPNQNGGNHPVNQVFESNISDPNFGVVEYRTNPGVSNVSMSFNLFTAVNGQRWEQVWTASQFGLRQMNVGNPYDTYLPLSISTGLSGSDGIQIAHNSTKINGNAHDSLSHAVRYFAGQGGVNNAITVTTPDPTWQPVAGDTLIIWLSTNSIAAGAACTVAVNGGPPYPIRATTQNSYLGVGYSPGGQITLTLDPQGNLRDHSQ